MRAFIITVMCLHLVAFLFECAKEPGYQPKRETSGSLFVGRVASAVMIAWAAWVLWGAP